MSDDDFHMVRGSGNVYRDFGYPDADIRQAKSILAAEIAKVMDARQWSTRKAEEVTGVNHADYSRIRRANISRFSLERLAVILGAMGQEVEFTVQVRPRVQLAAPALVHS